MLPVSCQRRIHLIAELALTSKRSAASRRDAPDSTVSSTRSRKSKEQGFGIDLPPKNESMPPHSIIQTSQGIPRFNPAEICSSIIIAFVCAGIRAVARPREKV
jgi:hypothetical protein